MIVDEADEPKALLEQDRTGRLPLSEYFPSVANEKGSLIVTSRDRSLAMDLTGQQEPIEVFPFKLDRARLLFRQKLGSQQTFPDTDECDQILELLMHLPLAISQAAAFIKQNSWSLKGYLDSLEAIDTEAIEDGLLDQGLGDLQRSSGTCNAVFATWKVSYNQISIDDRLAADFMSWMAVFDCEQIPLSLLYGSSKATHSERVAIGTLKNYRLVTELADGDHLSIHKLVHQSIQRWLHYSGLLDLRRREGVIKMSGKLPFYEPKAFLICKVLARHATVVVDYPVPQADQSHRAKVLLNLASYESHIGRYPEAFQRTAEAYKLLEAPQILELDESLDLKALAHASFVLSQTKQLPAAEEILRHAVRRLATRADVTMASEDMCDMREQLAEVLLLRGKYEEALSIHTSIYQIRRKASGETGLLTLVSERELARVLTKMSRFSEAEDYARRSYEQRRQQLGPDHAETLSSANQLALILHHSQQLNKALELYQTVFEIRQRVIGLEHPLTLTSLHNMEAALTYIKRYEEAEKINTQVYDIRKRILGPEHQDTLTSLNNRGTLAARLGQYDHAVVIFQQCFQSRTHTLGPNHEWTFGTKMQIAKTLAAAERYEEAKVEFDGLCDQHVRVLGLEHYQTQHCILAYKDFQAKMQVAPAPVKPVIVRVKPVIVRVYARVQQWWGLANPWRIWGRRVCGRTITWTCVSYGLLFLRRF